MLYLQKSCKVA